MKWTLVAVISAFFLFTGGQAHCQDRALPFSDSERMEYGIFWTKVKAGNATLEVRKASGDEQGYVFVAKARSNSFIDIFYKVRDTIESHVNEGVSQALLYRKKQREGDYHRDYRVVFNWDEFRAYRYGEHGLKNTVSIWPGTFDPLSILFYFRTKDLSLGYDFYCPVTDGEKTVIGRAWVVGREEVSTPAGKFDCFVVQPELTHVGGVFKKSPDAELVVWITADERKIPVKVQSEVVVGNFSLQLTKYHPGKSD